MSKVNQNLLFKRSLNVFFKKKYFLQAFHYRLNFSCLQKFSNRWRTLVLIKFDLIISDSKLQFKFILESQKKSIISNEGYIEVNKLLLLKCFYSLFYFFYFMHRSIILHFFMISILKKNYNLNSEVFQ